MDRFAWLVGAVLVAGLGVVAWQTVVSPSPSQQAGIPVTRVGGMMHPDLSSLKGLPEGAPIVDVALPDKLSSEARIGKRAFEAKCATCHGTNAAGQNGAAPPLIHPTYAPGHHPDEAFQRAAMNGVQSHHWPFGNMPPVKGLTRADVQYVVRYIRELQRENGIN